MDIKGPDQIFDLDQLRKIRIRGQSVKILVVFVLVLIVLFSSVYQIEPEQVGVIQRFGAYNRITESGLHFKIPFVEKVTKVRAQRQLKEEFGFRTEEPGVRTRYSQQNYDEESSMLSGDLNVAMVEWIVQYRISDPEKYLFKVRNVTKTFRDMNEAIVRAVVGDRTITEILTEGRQEIQDVAKTQLQQLCDLYETGITIDRLVLQDVNPPDPVRPSWDEVNQAQQQKDRLINEAKAEYNQVIPRAEGEAKQTILQAEGYALDRVNSARGDSARFKQQYAEYRRAPQVTRQRMYLETMQKILPQLGAKLYLDKDAKSVMPLLPMESIQAIGSAASGRKEGQQ
jgi:membrane protease subunit HflK